MASDTKQDIWDIWGFDGRDIYAVGTKALVLHFDGTAWKELNAGTRRDLSGVWGCAQKPKAETLSPGAKGGKGAG